MEHSYFAYLIIFIAIFFLIFETAYFISNYLALRNDLNLPNDKPDHEPE